MVTPGASRPHHAAAVALPVPRAARPPPPGPPGPARARRPGPPAPAGPPPGPTGRRPGAHRAAVRSAAGRGAVRQGREDPGDGTRGVVERQ
ncbi:hypothetical protein C0Q93_04910 [Streptomyces albidoflavus]|nr:hypothetical protein C0Q59_03855 [Streptomyces albidoflavus]RZE28136.1 hypothetical protein C0Q93_04910 [Streptomyces albidoflavus]RZE50532.1 hypothetical protein C0Q94_04915 [Streptomyces albidoflavus]